MIREEVTKQFYKLLTLVVILASGNVNALCLLEGIDIWPPPGDIPPNMVVLVSDYGGQLTGIESCEFRLVSSASDVVCLEVEATNSGFMEHQLLLRPVHLLTQGRSYSLRMDPESPRIQDWMREQRVPREPEGNRWFVNLPKDESRPQWDGSPRVIDVSISEFGCGPAIDAEVNLPQLDPNTLIRTEVSRQAGVQRSTYLIEPDYGTLHIGHGMCGGAFALKPGESYVGRLELMDVAGNVSATHKVVRFKIPDRERLIPDEGLTKFYRLFREWLQ